MQREVVKGDSMYTVGVDIGGTGIQAGIVNELGVIMHKKECVTRVEAGFEIVMKDIEKLIHDLLNERQLTLEEISSIGFGVPSFINQNGQASCINLHWHEVEFIEAINRMFSSTRVYAENDAKVATLAEATYGSMKDKRIGVMFTLGTGVGGGIVINGELLIGTHNMGGALGHIIIGENDDDCNCGNNGCLESFCSATAIVKEATKRVATHPNSLILKLAGDDSRNITAKLVFDAYREHDEVAIKVINRFKLYLAKGIASMINALDPDVICIGGGLSKSSDIILDKLDELVKQHLLYKNEEFAQIVCAQLSADAGIIGAAVLK